MGEDDVNTDCVPAKTQNIPPPLGSTSPGMLGIASSVVKSLRILPIPVTTPLKLVISSKSSVWLPLVSSNSISKSWNTEIPPSTEPVAFNVAAFAAPHPNRAVDKHANTNFFSTEAPNSCSPFT